MSTPRRELYIYYRVAEPHWRDALLVVQRWQRRLQDAHSGLTARVLRQPYAHDGAVTLMEVYASPGRAGGFDAALESEVAAAAAALEPWLIGARHVEQFDAAD